MVDSVLRIAHVPEDISAPSENLDEVEPLRDLTGQIGLPMRLGKAD